MEDSMGQSGIYRKVKVVSEIRYLLFICIICHCMHEFTVVCEATQEPPGCLFPDFLQSSGRGMGDWTWKYDGDVHLGKVTGGEYTICSKQYPRYTGDKAKSCQETQMRRKCVRQYGPVLFAVKHEEHRPTYQCIKFVQRSPAVVQLEVSDRHLNPEGICNKDMTLDHSPWISVKHYRTAVANCPFTGGYNFKEVTEYSRDHVGKRLCRLGVLAEKQAPVRVESDCVEKEGFTLQFREKSCIPEKSFFSKHQKLVCMATWQVDGDGFALLRKEHERSFYCIRVVFDNLEVTSIVMYLDWECYRRFDLTGEVFKLSYSTSYVVFQKVEKRIISIPCSDELTSCSASNDGDCQEKQCMQTCQQCLNSTGFPCYFDEDVIGSWDIRRHDKTQTILRIHKNSLHHSSLGILQCVTFNPEMRVALRVILWGTYQNGCYPRFICMYYDTPATNILRYRLSNVQQWPLELSDQSICSRETFLVSPDFNDPKDKYEEKPWNIALKSLETIRRMPCIYPIELPDSSSFVDNLNRSGCITFRSRTSPKTISMVYVSWALNPYTSEQGYFQEHDDRYHFHCIAAITYIGSFKTVMTVSQGNDQEVLCWMIVNAETVVVVNTSSCNKQTAHGILQGEPKFLQHLKFLLYLNAANDDVDVECRKISQNNEKKWLAQIKQNIERSDQDKSRSGGVNWQMGLFIYICLTLTFVVVINR